MRKFLLFPLILSIMLTLCACLPSEYENISDAPDPSLPAPASLEELYSCYNAVTREMTKADVELLFGVGEPSLDDFGDVKFINYFNKAKSAGVSVIYDTDGKVSSKTLYFNKKENLVPFSGRYASEKIPDVKKDMSVSSACDVMGSTPLELSCKFSVDDPVGSEKIYAWYNEDASNFMLHTKNDMITNVVFYRADAE